MINNSKVVALIPARANSKGLPGKNIKELCGKPLIAWPIDAAKGSRFIDKIICTTDGLEIAEIAKTYGAEVPFLRPSEFATETSPSSEFILHALDFLYQSGEDFDYIVLLEPTSPLTTSSDIDRALVLLHENRNIADSIVGVSLSEANNPMFAVNLDSNNRIYPWVEEGFSKTLRRQDIPEIYFKDGSLYISDIIAYKKLKKFYHDRTLGYKTKKWQSLEIDDYVDFICIEALAKNITFLNSLQF